jgi:hypothetical protein
LLKIDVDKVAVRTILSDVKILEQTLQQMLCVSESSPSAASWVLYKCVIVLKDAVYAMSVPSDSRLARRVLASS